MFSALYFEKTFQLRCPFSHDFSQSALGEITTEQKSASVQVNMCLHNSVSLTRNMKQRATPKLR